MSPLSLVPVFFVLALVSPAAWGLWKVYRRSSGRREVTCPEAQHFATVKLDARHAVVMHALGEDHCRVKACSLWPARADCAQTCVKGAIG